MKTTINKEFLECGFNAFYIVYVLHKQLYKYILVIKKRCKMFEKLNKKETELVNETLEEIFKNK